MMQITAAIANMTRATCANGAGIEQYPINQFNNQNTTPSTINQMTDWITDSPLMSPRIAIGMGRMRRHRVMTTL